MVVSDQALARATKDLIKTRDSLDNLALTLSTLLIPRPTEHLAGISTEALLGEKVRRTGAEWGSSEPYGTYKLTRRYQKTNRDQNVNAQLLIFKK